MRWSVLPGYENTFKRVLVSYINITSQRSAEREAALRRDQLVRAEKMVSLGTLVTGVAHEINNPNSFVTLNAPLVLDAWQKSLPILNLHAQQQGDFDLGIGSYLEMREEIQTLIEDMIEGGNRIRTIVNALRDFARSTPAKAFSAISINDVVHSTATLLRTTIQKHTRNFSIQYGSDIPPVQANLQKLEQVLMNLTRNALPKPWTPTVSPLSSAQPLMKKTRRSVSVWKIKVAAFPKVCFRKLSTRSTPRNEIAGTPVLAYPSQQPSWRNMADT